MMWNFRQIDVMHQVFGCDWKKVAWNVANRVGNKRVYITRMSTLQYDCTRDYQLAVLYWRQK